MVLWIVYVIIVLTYYNIKGATNMEQAITLAIGIVVAIVGVVITSMKERKDIANLKEYIKEDIKEYLKNDIKKDLISTKEITNFSIDPNVLKILNLSEYLYKDTEYKNRLSEEYKGKIDRNLMISNIDSVYDKIVDLEIEKSKIKEELLKEKSEIYNDKENLKNENYYLKERIEELQIENKNLKEQLREKKQKEYKGFSR